MKWNEKKINQKKFKKEKNAAETLRNLIRIFF